MHRFLLLGLICLATASDAYAQDEGKPLWEVGVFAGGVSTPAYPGSVDRTQRALVLPFLIYRGEVLRAERGSFGARVARNSNYELDIGFSASLPASSDNVAARQGMPDLGTLIEFGPRLKLTLARPAPDSQLRLDLPLRGVLEFNGVVRDQGVAFEPALVFEKANMGDDWSLSSSAGLMIGDQKLNQYFYGVSSTYATANRPRYDAQPGLISSRLGVSVSKKFTPDLRLAAFVRYESYMGGANRDSPLHLASTGVLYGLGMTWSLSQSKDKAKN